MWNRGLYAHPDAAALVQRQASLALIEGDTVAANRYIEKYKSVRNARGAVPATIASGLAWIYSRADLLDTAEEYYRKALSL